MKKKLMMPVLLAVGMIGAAVWAAEPLARLTTGTVTVPLTTTTAASEKWLNTGTDGATITGTGAPTLTGAGNLRAVFYTRPSTTSNGAIAFVAYDGGARHVVHYVTNLNEAGTGRYNFTTNIFTGRMLVEISQRSTNVVNTWTWGAIVE